MPFKGKTPKLPVYSGGTEAENDESALACKPELEHDVYQYINSSESGSYLKELNYEGEVRVLLTSNKTKQNSGGKTFPENPGLYDFFYLTQDVSVDGEVTHPKDAIYVYDGQAWV